MPWISLLAILATLGCGCGGTGALRVVRYAVAADPAPAPIAIIIAMPGFLGGGPSFDGIARSVVRRCTEDGFPVEVWAIDRRSNGMEDLAGMNDAESAGDAEIA